MTYGIYNNPLNQMIYDMFKHHDFSIHDIDTYVWWEPRRPDLKHLLPRIVIGDHKYPTETIKPQQFTALSRFDALIKMGQDFGMIESGDKTGVFIFRSTIDPKVFEVSPISNLKNTKTMTIYELEYWFSGGDLEGRKLLTPEEVAETNRRNEMNEFIERSKIMNKKAEE